MSNTCIYHFCRSVLRGTDIRVFDDTILYDHCPVKSDQERIIAV